MSEFPGGSPPRESARRRVQAGALFSFAVASRRGSARTADPRGATMPKQKTHKGSKKRFRVSANGKLMRSQAGKKHLLSHKTGKRKRQLREKIVDSGKLAKKYILIMGGHA